MTTYEACRSDWLALAVSEATPGISAALFRWMGSEVESADRRILVVKTAGEALRLIHRHQPGILLVCVDVPELALSTSLIDVVHRRRPELAQIAVTEQHHESIERAVRAAGAAYYFALDSSADDELLRSVLRGQSAAPPVPRRGLSPPKSRGRPPARRHRTGRSSFG